MKTGSLRSVHVRWPYARGCECVATRANPSSHIRLSQPSRSCPLSVGVNANLSRHRARASHASTSCAVCSSSRSDAVLSETLKESSRSPSLTYIEVGELCEGVRVIRKATSGESCAQASRPRGSCGRGRLSLDGERLVRAVPCRSSQPCDLLCEILGSSRNLRPAI